MCGLRSSRDAIGGRTDPVDPGKRGADNVAPPVRQARCAPAGRKFGLPIRIMLSNTILLLALAAPLQPSSGAPSDLPPDAVSIRLPRDPRVAPDGDSLAFTWRGDLWTASIDGGEATRMTIHPGEDRSPAFSPDGKTIYFVSNRSGRDQIHAMPSGGGAARQITFDSNPKTLLEATADGEGLLIRQGTDRGWHYSERDRLMIVPLDGDGPKRMLFDAGVRDGALSPDGQHALFCRGYSSWSRKGYQGPQAAQRE